MERIRFLLFKAALNVALWFSAEDWVKKKIKGFLVCLERQREMDACIRPRTATRKRGGGESSNRRHYTDLDERNEYTNTTKGAERILSEMTSDALKIPEAKALKNSHCKRPYLL